MQDAQTHDYSSDAQHAQQALRGDTQAFCRLIEAHYEQVYRIGLIRLGQADLAEDLAQEVFLRAYLHLEQLSDDTKFGAWVGRIARNLAMDWMRQRTREAARLVPQVIAEGAKCMEEIPDTRTDNARQLLDQKRQMAALQKALAALSEPERELVVLHYVEGLSHQQMATHLNLARTTITSRLRSAMKALRKALGTDEEQQVAARLTQALQPKHEAVVRAGALAVVLAALPLSARQALAEQTAALAVKSLQSAAVSKSLSVAAKDKVTDTLLWVGSSKKIAVLALLAAVVLIFANLQMGEMAFGGTRREMQQILTQQEQMLSRIRSMEYQARLDIDLAHPNGEPPVSISLSGKTIQRGAYARSEVIREQRSTDEHYADRMHAVLVANSQYIGLADLETPFFRKVMHNAKGQPTDQGKAKREMYMIDVLDFARELGERSSLKRHVTAFYGPKFWMGPTVKKLPDGKLRLLFFQQGRLLKEVVVDPAHGCLVERLRAYEPETGDLHGEVSMELKTVGEDSGVTLSLPVRASYVLYQPATATKPKSLVTSSTLVLSEVAVNREYADSLFELESVAALTTGTISWLTTKPGDPPPMIPRRRQP